jgi:transcriptional regulator with XRE-family HTH domain
MGVDYDALCSQALKQARRLSGLSQRELASRAGVPQSEIGKIETRSRQPSLPSIGRLIDAAGVPIGIRVVTPDRHSALNTSWEVSRRLRRDTERYADTLRQEDAALRAVIDLKDALRRSDPERVRSLVFDEPDPTGDNRWDAFIAAVVEDECARKTIPCPKWTQEPERFVKPFWHLSEGDYLRQWELGTAPASYVRHGVLAAEEELAST